MKQVRIWAVANIQVKRHEHSNSKKFSGNPEHHRDCCGLQHHQWCINLRWRGLPASISRRHDTERHFPTVAERRGQGDHRPVRLYDLGSPQIMQLAIDPDEDFIDVECVAEAAVLPLQSYGVESSELNAESAPRAQRVLRD